jgi:hypothetical protein
MAEGGTAILAGVIAFQTAKQRTIEQTLRVRYILLPAVLTFMLTVIAGQGVQLWFMVAFGIGILFGYAGGLQANHVIRRAHERVPELMADIHRNLFDGGLWREVIESESKRDGSVAGIHLAKPKDTFHTKLNALFSAYPSICREKGLRPYNDLYAVELNAMLPAYEYGSPMLNLWKYALAQVLREEFLPQGREG